MTGKLWPLLAGFSIWAIGFLALYAAQALGCAWQLPATEHRAILIGISVLTVGALIGLLIRQALTDRLSSQGQAAIGLTAAATAAAIVISAPVTFASLCV